MAIRTVQNGIYRLYDQQADEEYYRSDIAAVAYMCGLDGQNVAQYTLEELIEAIKDTFPELPHELVVNQSLSGPEAENYNKTKFFKHAAGCYSYKNQRLLIISARRAWRMASLAAIGNDNG